MDIKQRRESLTVLLSVGTQMSNVMFNLSQRKPELITQNDLDRMSELRQQWDKARSTWNKTKGRLDP